LHHAFDFKIATNDWVELSFARCSGEVATELIENE
jgi:hypothetical protein